MQEEQAMNDRLEEAGLNELFPGFDREATWKELQQRIPQQQPEKKKKIIALGWYSHAAAVLLGVLLTYGLLSLRKEAGQRTPVAAVYTKLPPAMPKLEKGQDQEWRRLKRSNDSLKSLLTLMEQQPVKTRIIEKIVSVPVRQQHIAQQQPVIPGPEISPALVPDKTTAPTVAKAPELKVVHYMDIDNEDQSIMVKPAPTVFESKVRVRVNKPESRTYRPEQTVLPLRELFTVSQ